MSTTSTTTFSPCPTCGCSSVSISSTLVRVVNGNTAIPNSWPWIVAIYENGQFSCGGSLISYRHVLTAAHCLIGVSPSSLTIYAGLHKLSDRKTSQSRSVISIWYHPDYNNDTIDYDIGIIKLSSAFTGTGTTSLGCLPSASNPVPSLNEKGMVIGWGQTSATADVSNESTLQQVMLQVQNTSPDCDLGSSTNRKFCAGFGPTGACFGDSGGPIMTNVNNTWTCTGIVSYVRSNCNGRSVFTRVSFYRSLIDAKLQTM
ncbi:unnamed protein product [Rotaria sp. Silwood2]|nr:unnamed protein product [Rotaria sp. Silwood2]